MVKIKNLHIEHVLEKILLYNFSLFLILGVYNKKIPKTSLIIGFLIFIINILYQKIVHKKGFSLKNIFNLLISEKLAIFLFISLLTCFFSVNKKLSFEIWSERYLYYFIFYLFGLYLGKEFRNLNFLIKSLLIGAVILSLGIIRDWLIYNTRERVFTTWGISIMFIFYLYYSLPFFVFLSIKTRRFLKKIVYMLGTVLILFGLALHASRGVFISLFIAFLISAIFMKKFRKISFIMIGVLCMFILIIPYSRNRVLLSMIGYLFQGSTYLGYSGMNIDTNILKDRLLMCESAFKIFLKNPIFGTGLGTYGELMYKVVDVKRYINTNHLHAHNTYLEVLAEMGILGFLSFISIFVNFFIKSFNKTIHMESRYHFAFILMLIITLICELSGNNLLVGVSNASMFWFLFGLGYSNFNPKSSKEVVE